MHLSAIPFYCAKINTENQLRAVRVDADSAGLTSGTGNWKDRTIDWTIQYSASFIVFYSISFI